MYWESCENSAYEQSVTMRHEAHAESPRMPTSFSGGAKSWGSTWPEKYVQELPVAPLFRGFGNEFYVVVESRYYELP